MRKIYLFLMLFFAIASGVSAQEQVDIQQLQQSAQQGDAESQFRLAQCYEQGNGVDKNKDSTYYWYKKAAMNNHPEASALYGTVLLIGGGDALPKNVAEGVKYLRNAAKQHNETAITVLVGFYLTEVLEKEDYGISKYVTEDEFLSLLKELAETSSDEKYEAILNNWPRLRAAFADKQTLVAKYGEKAYNNIKQGNVYVGMPEGILTAYKTVEANGARYTMYNLKGSYRNKYGTYKIYVPNAALQLLNQVGQVVPNQVKVVNGKVTKLIY